MLASTLEPLHTTLTDRQRDILDESGFTMLTTNAAAVLNCAFLLAPFLLSTMYVTLPPTLSPSAAAPSTTPAGDVTRMRMNGMIKERVNVDF